MAVVRHDVPKARWPDAGEAAASRLFSPVTLGPVTAETRTWVPAMVPWRATDDGLVTQNVLDWYARFADGRPGVLVVEATGIRDIPSGPLLRVGDDRFVPGLKKLADTVRKHSGGKTRLLLQIIDFLTIRRRPEKQKFFDRFLALTDRHRAAAGSENDDAVRSYLTACDDDRLRDILTAREYRDYAYGYREEVSDLHLPHIAELPKGLPGLFASAALRAQQAGFDGVELHFAHAYTMASFLSRSNMRTDGYGGTRENRLRLPLEVFSAVQSSVDPGFAVGARFLGDEVVEGGSRIEDAIEYGVGFARAGFDFLSVSKGGKFDDARQPKVGDAVYPYTGPSGLECMPTVKSDERGPFGRNVHLARAIRAAVRDAGHKVPVVTAGGICDFDMAEGILQRGEADAIAAARQSLADPDWWEKIRTGQGAEIRRCIYTNYCEGLDQKHKQVTCQLWDREFDSDESGVTRSNDGKRRLLPPRWHPGT